MNYCVGLGVGDWGVYSSNAPVRGRVGGRGEDKRGKATKLVLTLIFTGGVFGEIKNASGSGQVGPDYSTLAISYLAARLDLART